MIKKSFILILFALSPIYSFGVTEEDVEELYRLSRGYSPSTLSDEYGRLARTMIYQENLYEVVEKLLKKSNDEKKIPFYGGLLVTSHEEDKLKARNLLKSLIKKGNSSYSFETLKALLSSLAHLAKPSDIPVFLTWVENENREVSETALSVLVELFPDHVVANASYLERLENAREAAIHNPDKVNMDKTFDVILGHKNDPSK